jgi:hypothetical protein
MMKCLQTKLSATVASAKRASSRTLLGWMSPSNDVIAGVIP